MFARSPGVKELIPIYEPRASTLPGDSTSPLVTEENTIVKGSPVPLCVHSQVEIPLRTPAKQQETPPSSPQDESHPKRRVPSQTQTPTPHRPYARPPTPENPTLSTNHRSVSSSASSLKDVQNQLSRLTVELADLRYQLNERERAEATLRSDLNEAIKKYDEAINNLRKSQEETSALEDQVRRLREELREERAQRQDLEDEIEVRRRRQRELEDQVNAMTRREQGRRNMEDRMETLEEAVRAVEKGGSAAKRDWRKTEIQTHLS